MKTLFLDARDRYQKTVSIKDNGRVLGEITGEAGLLNLIDELLMHSGFSVSELEKIEVCAEGGSYTGIRISLSIARALSYALGLPDSSAV